MPQFTNAVYLLKIKVSSQQTCTGEKCGCLNSFLKARKSYNISDCQNSTYVCMYVFMYVCMYECMYVCGHFYEDIHRLEC